MKNEIEGEIHEKNDTFVSGLTDNNSKPSIGIDIRFLACIRTATPTNNSTTRQFYGSV
jgi:hypothetical protein